MRPLTPNIQTVLRCSKVEKLKTLTYYSFDVSEGPHYFQGKIVKELTVLNASETKIEENRVYYMTLCLDDIHQGKLTGIITEATEVPYL